MASRSSLRLARMMASRIRCASAMRMLRSSATIPSGKRHSGIATTATTQGHPTRRDTTPAKCGAVSESRTSRGDPWLMMRVPNRSRQPASSGRQRGHRSSLLSVARAKGRCAKPKRAQTCDAGSGRGGETPGRANRVARVATWNFAGLPALRIRKRHRKPAIAKRSSRKRFSGSVQACALRLSSDRAGNE